MSFRNCSGASWLPFLMEGDPSPKLAQASVPGINPRGKIPYATRAEISFVHIYPWGPGAWLGKHPYSTKIELCLQLIPDEQVLLFKGPNPLQSTQWNLRPLFPLPLYTVRVCCFFVFSLPSFPASVFLPVFCFSWISSKNKRMESGVSRGNLHEENHLREPKLSPPFPPGECLTECAVLRHNSGTGTRHPIFFIQTFSCASKQWIPVNSRYDGY